MEVLGIFNDLNPSEISLVLEIIEKELLDKRNFTENVENIIKKLYGKIWFFLSREHVEEMVKMFAMYTDISVQEIPIRFNPNEISIDEILFIFNTCRYL